MKVTRRDLKFFFLGVLTVFLLESVLNWEDTKKAFQDGFDAASNKTEVSD